MSLLIDLHFKRPTLKDHEPLIVSALPQMATILMFRDRRV